MKKLSYQKEKVEQLRVNSRIKHFILKDYFPTWARILGSWNKELNYFDCFAGPGQYQWKGEIVEGSPIIIIKETSELLSTNFFRHKKINLLFVEEDIKQKKKLETQINKIPSIPSNLKYKLEESDSETIVEKEFLQKEAKIPSFFFIDPYAHPFPLQLMRKIMEKPLTEIMVNFMYHQIIRDIPNLSEEQRCLKLFYPDDPRNLDFKTKNKFDQDKILGYLHNRIGAKYYIPFSVNFGPDERISSNRVKYFLIHYSNNFKAFNIMLYVMWKHSKSGKPLTVSDGQYILFPEKSLDNLEKLILDKYNGTGIMLSFEVLVEENWPWYFLETHYREVLIKLEKEKIIEVERISSKRTGLKEKDIIIFKEL